jgi:hypothetical protein
LHTLLAAQAANIRKDGPTMAFAKKQHDDIPLAAVDFRDVWNPILPIICSPDFRRCGEALLSTPGSELSLVGGAGRALLFTLVRNLRPDHVVEIGTFKGGTSEAICLALEANNCGTLHTVGPFDSGHFQRFFRTWPGRLKSRLKFYPTDSMDFYMQMTRAGVRPGIVFVDGNHDYEFALFDIQCAARALNAGGFIVVDNISQAGPYYAALDFLAANPLWTNCVAQTPNVDARKAYDPERKFIPHTDFIVLRAPMTHIVATRPRTFGEVPWPTRTVEGLKVELVERQKGTLHVQCVLRGFGPVTMLERGDNASVGVDDSSGGDISIHFEEPLTLPQDCSAYRVEPWLIWDGEQPLQIVGPPQIL